MTFNWFQRKFDDDKDPKNQPVEPASPEVKAPESTPQSPTVSPASQDLLNWAKAAYANVQQQVEVIESKIIEPITEPETQVDESEAIETVPEIELEPVTSEPVAVPFWMQSESDRLARIAALEATAIVEPEPEVKPAPRRKATIKFDDDFIWSAEVLASQGRRPEEISVEEITWLNRLRQGLDKTRLSLVNQLKAIVGQGPLSADSVDDIEALLLQADVGVKATPMLIPEKNQLNIWLITGVNGAGKTTTIGKLSHLSVKSGYKTLIAAADTFRAAAVEQVKSWGLRSNVDVICNPAQNADPAAVVFDAISAAQARGTELLLVDTAGRLQNKKNLMEELSKIRRIVDKKSADAKIESLLVLDSTLGQNGLKQAEVFAQSAGITGVILTKLDGTAKGGVVIGISDQFKIPVKYIGLGEGMKDLQLFNKTEFVDSLFKE